MSLLSTLANGLSLATLRETRQRLRSWWGRLLVASIASVYALISMLVGQMLILSPISGGYFAEIVVQRSTQWWNYPGVLVVQPWGVLALPFFPTIAMLLVSFGVGLGGSIGIILLIPLLRRVKGVDRRATASGTAAGVGPAITGLATMGACCCTGCVGAAGVTIVAAASGTSINNLLLNDWYIGVFQLAVVYVSLMAQERALRLTADYCPIPPPMDRRFALGALLRIGLLVAGITWSLAMFVEWADVPPLSAGAPLWYHWIFEHQLLSVLALSAGLFPKEFASVVRRLATTVTGRSWRVLLLIAGVSWGTWVPAAFVGVGLGGFVNELFGFLGFPAAWGAEAPDAALGFPLYFHWAFQHVLLSGFAVSVAVAPRAASAPLLWTVAGSRPSSAERAEGPSIPPGQRSPLPPAPAANVATPPVGVPTQASPSPLRGQAPASAKGSFGPARSGLSR